jgi:hypothetical protein
MSKKKRLSHDQKRKAKLAKEARKNPKGSPLAYTGNKYKTDELVPIVFETELAIHEADVMSGRVLADRMVEKALEKLILELRKGPLPPLEDSRTFELKEGEEAETIVQNIRGRWMEFFERNPRHTTETLIGVLRTLLGSISVWSRGSRQSRGYLSFIEGFMKKGGVRVQRFSEDMEPDEEEEDDELLEIGRAWILDGQREARAEFIAKIEELYRAGEPDRAAEICQQLIGEGPRPGDLAELSALALRAHHPGSSR